MDTIEKATAVRPVKDVACHNDLLSENFIIDATDVGHRLGATGRMTDRSSISANRRRAPVLAPTRNA